MAILKRMSILTLYKNKYPYATVVTIVIDKSII